ncbi:hypothetical protein [Peribacillus asahii]|uniref:hypothetical protein n=1 Tax=Peribacillus asahii TaxID=228899 RepID=UPI003817029E
MLLKFAIQDFKGDREFKNLSERTIETYMAQLKVCFHSILEGYRKYKVDMTVF